MVPHLKLNDFQIVVSYSTVHVEAISLLYGYLKTPVLKGSVALLVQLTFHRERASCLQGLSVIPTTAGERVLGTCLPCPCGCVAAPPQRCLPSAPPLPPGLTLREAQLQHRPTGHTAGTHELNFFLPPHAVSGFEDTAQFRKVLRVLLLSVYTLTKVFFHWPLKAQSSGVVVFSFTQKLNMNIWV